MIHRLGINNFKQALLFIIATIYVVGVSVYHLLVLVPLIVLVPYFLVQQKLLYVYSIPFLSLYLLFISFGGTNFSVSFTVLCLLGGISLIRFFEDHLKQKITRVFIIYILGMSFGLIYSPDINLGIKLTMYNLLAFLIMLAGQQIASKYSVESVLKNIVIFGLPIGIANVVFLLVPDLEISFLHTSVAKLFIDPGALRVLFDEGYNNILDPRKAGTFFVNTNMAAVFFGILLWSSLSLRLKSKVRSYNIPVIIYFLALLSTNSRAGLGAFVFTLFLLILLNIKKKKTWFRLLIFTFPILSLGMLFVSSGLFDNIVSRLSIEAIESDPRMIIWQFALSHIHPLSGLGYGGWEQISYQMGAELGKLPPHNNFLIAWSWSGILGVISLATLVFGVMYMSMKRYKDTGNALYLSLMGAYGIVFFEGMFDNYFLHLYNISVLLFLITGLVLFDKKGINNKN
ncbi:O-antigen ligase family protein [Priestia sp. YIM B13486]|uniref:O-antigen ligase family protein n=1 Tax=Priestia sp. YIM B13486 TaxID=3366304 RepID=UPI00366FF0F1